METLQSFHKENPVYDENVSKHIAFGLMTKGANTLAAAFELALGGYLWEPSILLRSGLEGFATAWDVVHNKHRFDLWKTRNKKFDSSVSISNVKEVTAVIGKLYGHLSTMNVHTSALNSSPSMVLNEDQPKFQFLGFISEGKESIRRSEIYMCLFVTYICLQLVELVFYKYSRELETIEIVSGADQARTKVSERHRKFVDEFQEYFKRVVEGDTTHF